MSSKFEGLRPRPHDPHPKELKDMLSAEAVQEVAKLVALWQKNKDMELEVRHRGILRQEVFCPGISDKQDSFLHGLLRKMNKSRGSLQMENSTDVSYHDVPIRAQTISGQPTKYQCKVAEASVTLLYFVDGKNVGNLRVALSTETDAGSELLQHYSIHERKSSTRKKRRMTAIDPKNRYKYELTYVTESNITHGLPDTETKEFEIELIHGDEFENRKPPEVVAEYLLTAAAESFREQPSIRRTFAVMDKTKPPYIWKPTVKLELRRNRHGAYDFSCIAGESHHGHRTMARVSKHGGQVLNERVRQYLSARQADEQCVAHCFWDIQKSEWQIQQWPTHETAHSLDPDTMEKVMAQMERRIGR